MSSEYYIALWNLYAYYYVLKMFLMLGIIIHAQKPHGWQKLGYGSAQTVTHTFSLGLYLDLDFEKRCIVKFMA